MASTDGVALADAGDPVCSLLRTASIDLGRDSARVGDNGKQLPPPRLLIMQFAVRQFRFELRSSVVHTLDSFHDPCFAKVQMVGDIQVVAIINQDRQPPHAGQIDVDLQRRILAGDLT